MNYTSAKKLIKFLAIFSTLFFFFSCHTREEVETIKKAESQSSPTYTYKYKGKTYNAWYVYKEGIASVVNSGSDSEFVSNLLDRPNISSLSYSSDPTITYIFDSSEERDQFVKNEDLKKDRIKPIKKGQNKKFGLGSEIILYEHAFMNGRSLILYPDQPSDAGGNYTSDYITNCPTCVGVYGLGPDRYSPGFSDIATSMAIANYNYELRLFVTLFDNAFYTGANKLFIVEPNSSAQWVGLKENGFPNDKLTSIHWKKAF